MMYRYRFTTFVIAALLTGLPTAAPAQRMEKLGKIGSFDFVRMASPDRTWCSAALPREDRKPGLRMEGVNKAGVRSYSLFLPSLSVQNGPVDVTIDSVGTYRLFARDGFVTMPLKSNRDIVAIGGRVRAVVGDTTLQWDFADTPATKIVEALEKCGAGVPIN